MNVSWELAFYQNNAEIRTFRKGLISEVSALMCRVRTLLRFCYLVMLGGECPATENTDYLLKALWH